VVDSATVARAITSEVAWIRAEQLRDPAHALDLALLHAIPLNHVPARALPTGTDTIGQLCEGPERQPSGSAALPGGPGPGGHPKPTAR
jgi:hypothetical protein